MNAYKVTAAFISIHTGILGLILPQAQARMHRLTPLGENRYELSNPPVQFKRGEVFEIEGELPKPLRRSIEAISISPMPRARNRFHPEPKAKGVQSGNRTALATATREAGRVNRLRALRRFIDDVYEALDKAGHEIGKKGHRKRLPVSADALRTLFCTRHPEHKVAQSTFNDDLGTIAKLKPGPKRYEIKQLAEMLAGQFSVD